MTGQRWSRALITGASSGIGREMARILAGEGTDLVIVARDRDRLEALAAEFTVEVEVLPADLASAGALARVQDRLGADDAPIDLLVNNAGLGFMGELAELPAEKSRLTLDVNVVALHDLCDTAARTMMARGHGAILNVSSMAGELAGPGTATYNATKAYVTSLSQSLHIELEPHGVTVSCLCPGLTRTEFQDRAGWNASEVPDFAWQSAAEVAAIGLDATAAGKAVVVPGALNKVVSRVARSLPRVAVRKAAGASAGRFES